MNYGKLTLCYLDLSTHGYEKTNKKLNGNIQYKHLNNYAQTFKSSFYIFI